MANIKDIKPKDKNGKPHGEWLSYHDNGQLLYRRNYVHGISHGVCEGYNDDGRLMYYGCANMGRRVGYWYFHKMLKFYYLCLI